MRNSLKPRRRNFFIWFAISEEQPLYSARTSFCVLPANLTPFVMNIIATLPTLTAIRGRCYFGMIPFRLSIFKRVNSSFFETNLILSEVERRRMASGVALSAYIKRNAVSSRFNICSATLGFLLASVHLETVRPWERSAAACWMAALARPRDTMLLAIIIAIKYDIN